MRYAIQSTPTGCTVSKTESHLSTQLPVPVMAGDLTAAIATMLADADRKETEVGPVQIVKTADGISIRTAQGQVTIGWQHLWSIERVPA